MDTHHRPHCGTPVSAVFVCVFVCVCVCVDLLAVMVSTREWLETRFLT